MKASEVRKGQVIEHEGTAYQVRDIERSAPTARGGNVTFRFTLYSVPGNRKLDLSLRADDGVAEVSLERRQATFSYRDGESCVFMDDETFVQYALDAAAIDAELPYLVPGLAGCYVQLIDDAPVGVQVPATVTLAVVDTTPELKGASATKRSKPARLETDLEIQVPDYVAVGEQVIVNTATGTFAGRA